MDEPECKEAQTIPSGKKKSRRFYPRIPADLLQCPWLGPNAKLIYGVLMSFADLKTLEAYPSLDILSEAANLNRRTIQRAIRELVPVFMEPPIRPKGRGRKSTLYRLKIPPKEVCQKRPSISLHTPPGVLLNEFPEGVPSPKWIERMNVKHDCGGCGWCIFCRRQNSKLTA